MLPETLSPVNASIVILDYVCVIRKERSIDEKNLVIQYIQVVS